MLICSVSGANHLPKAACLAKSLTDTQGPHQFMLCLVERDRSAVRGIASVVPNIVIASELDIPDFELFIFQQQSRYQACCALKARVLLRAMRAFPEEDLFVYLDPDIRAYSRFCELEAMLERSSIVLTPHHLRRDCSFQNLREDVLRTLPCGIFNAGFLAFRRSQIALEFLEWWNRKLEVLCVGDGSKGLYFDQRWLDMAISFFDISVCREPGYNVAHWNIYERCISLSKEFGAIAVNEKPLRFFHFSMVDSGRDMFYFRKYASDDNPIFTMRADYVRDTYAVDMLNVHELEWSFDRYISGEQILPMAREFFRRGTGACKLFHDPFHSSNAEILGKMGRLTAPT